MPVPAFNVINGGSHAGNKLAMVRRTTLLASVVRDGRDKERERERERERES